MINIGIVGVGGIAGVHLSSYRALENAHIAALCDIIPERARGEQLVSAINIGAVDGGGALQVASYLDYREFVRDADIEVVDICLPTDLHAEVAIAALEAGKHVLCEKPMALTVAECDRMIDAAQASGRFLMIAHCIRFWPEYLALKEIVESGQYGAITWAFFRRLSGLPKWSPWFPDPKRSGGAILDLHIHDVDFIQYLLGLPSSVDAVGVEDAHGIGQVLTRYGYEQDAVIYAEGAWAYPPTLPFRMTFLVRLAGATVEYNPGEKPFTVYPEEGDPFTPALLPGDGYQREIAYFLECVTRGVAPSIVTAHDARESVRLVLAEAQSVRSGQPVMVS